MTVQHFMPEASSYQDLGREGEGGHYVPLPGHDKTKIPRVS